MKSWLVFFMQGMGCWGFKMMYRHVRIKMCKWCGKCLEEQNLRVWTAIRKGSNNHSGESLFGLLILITLIILHWNWNLPTLPSCQEDQADSCLMNMMMMMIVMPLLIKSAAHVWIASSSKAHMTSIICQLPSPSLFQQIYMIYHTLCDSDICKYTNVLSIANPEAFMNTIASCGFRLMQLNVSTHECLCQYMELRS